jgi:single-stranded DNA-binding protein
MKNEKDEFESNFYNVSVFGRTGEYLLDRIQKGTLVQVTGDLLLQTYQDKTTGESKRSLNIQASKVRPLAFTKDAPRRSTTSEQASIDPEPDNRPF